MHGHVGKRQNAQVGTHCKRKQHPGATSRNAHARAKPHDGVRSNGALAVVQGSCARRDRCAPAPHSCGHATTHAPDLPADATCA
eukprot:4103258-Prymnesium_polylepis.1